MTYPEDYPASVRDLIIVYCAAGVGVVIGLCLYACFLS
jgi:hypothetical protein